MKKNKRVLLADLGKTDVVQDIPYLCKRAGCEVVVLCPRSSWLLKSTQWDTWIEVTDKEAYIRKLRELTESNLYDWVLLADEGSLSLVNDCSDEDPILSSTLPLSNRDHRTMLGSKAGLYKVCMERDITMPKSMLYDGYQNLKETMETWNFPVLTKIDRSAGGRGVTYCKDVRQLVEVIENTPKDKKTGLIIQEYIQGDNISVEALYKGGHLLAYASSKVLKSWNGEFSESCVRSYFFDPSLELLVRHIGQSLGICGFASMTFMRRKDSYFIFECDLRTQVWFRHAQFVGVDFSQAIVNYLSGGTELIRPNVPEGEEVLLKFFSREILRCIQEGDYKGLLEWCLNKNGVWKFIPSHDRKTLMANFMHIGTRSLKLLYNKPHFSFFKSVYRSLKSLKGHTLHVLVVVYDIFGRIIVRAWRIVNESIIIAKRIFSRRRGKLPDFLIIGVKKGGTTFLEKALNNHPLIEMSPHFSEFKKFGMRFGINKKEVHFFNRHPRKVKNIDWYKSLFNDNGKLQGEASPTYVVESSTCRRMHAIVPKAKLILMLRDPVTRAYSDYNQYLQNREVPKLFSLWSSYGVPNPTFIETMRTEYAKKICNSFLARGFYDDQIKELFELYSREQVLILISEQVKEDPEGSIRTVLSFLGLPYIPLSFEREVHVRTYKKPISDQEVHEVYEMYKPHNEELFKMLGYQIPDWDHSGI